MTPEIQQLITQRFRHFALERCLPLLHPDQPDDGRYHVRGDGSYPAVQMITSIWWFPDRTRRPKNREGSFMKSKAPAGPKPLLLDDARAKAVVAVEGEGHALALRSIGWQGIVVAGGVQGLRSNRPEACEQRRKCFAGRDVYILFDWDAAGREAAPLAAKQALEAGATRVAVIERPEQWPEGLDVEDWLAGFETVEQAFGTLCQVLGGARWATKSELEEAAEDDDHIPVAELLVPIPGAELAFITTVYDGADQRFKLAVHGPLAAQAQHAWSVQHDVSGPHSWQVVDEWRHAGITYRPKITRDLREMVTDRQFILPAPPEAHGGHQALWEDVRTYLRQWIALPGGEDYDVLTAYAFFTFVIHAELAFDYCPYLRFYGPPGSGKTWVFDVLRRICYRSLSGRGTSGNLHRMIDFYGPVALAMDEMHLDKCSSEERQTYHDILAQGSERSGGVFRCEGKNHEPTRFKVFGPKICAGYGADEHEALARRTISIDMRAVPADGYVVRVTIPKAMDEQAYRLRARLLDWRIGWRPPATDEENESPLVKALTEAGGAEVAKYCWPLLAVAAPSAVQNILAVAARRREATRASRAVSPEAVLLDALAKLALPNTAGRCFVPTGAIVDEIKDKLRIDAAAIGQELAKLGLKSTRRRVDGSRPMRGVDVGAEHSEIFRRYGIEWPPAAPEPRAEAVL